MKKSVLAAGLALGILGVGGGGYAVGAAMNAPQPLEIGQQRYEITSIDSNNIMGEAISSGVYLYNDGAFPAYKDIKVGSIVEVKFGKYEDDIQDVKVIK